MEEAVGLCREGGTCSFRRRCSHLLRFV